MICIQGNNELNVSYHIVLYLAFDLTSVSAAMGWKSPRSLTDLAAFTPP